MKKHIIILSIAAAILSGCASQRPAVDPRADISWQAFCQARGYDPADNTYAVINEYLDAWCGSAEEENALINAGQKPF